MNLARTFTIPLLFGLFGVACGSSTPTGPDLLAECADANTPGCNVRGSQIRQNPQTSDADVKALVAGNTAFALDLHQQLRGTKGNLFYSPFSISEALVMTYAGARGETEAQMAKALHFTLPQAQLHPAFNSLDLSLMSRGDDADQANGKAFVLQIANSMWGQIGFPFEQPFLDTISGNYSGGIHVADFVKSPEPSREMINKWVEDYTGFKIKDLLPQGSITSDTRFVLVNAIYFNAAWQTPFQLNNTKAHDFTRDDGSKVSVPTMFGGQESGYVEGDGYQAVELPYDKAELDMVLVLPTAGTMDAFEASLTPEKLATITSGLSEHIVSMSMPKFKYTSSFSLVDPLSALGMTDAFSDAADLSGISAKGGLSISDVVHKAYVAVDEIGTEAAAATGVIGGVTSAPPPAEIHLDHPFLFVIRDKPTGAILFVGRVMDPTAS